ncbi:MAG: DNRLRE domain-containing protein [Verrucomicrobia bacterium]|nr:DNRLRE domain-containing protein [Verrucomicrobiota bacterium]
MNFCRIFWSRVLVITLSSTSIAGSISLPPVADTTITEKATPPPTTELNVGTTGPTAGSKSGRALLQFDIAANLPSNAIITAAALTVKVTKAPMTAVNSTFDLRKVLVSWSESDATWSNRMAATPWSTNGGGIGVDFSSIISQTNFITGTGLYTFVSNSNLVADVQNWLLNLGSNFGWVVISELQGTNFTERTLASREDTANAPSLAIQFSLPATPPTLTPLPLSTNQFSFSFNVESNRTYAVEFDGAQPATHWTVLTNIAAQAAPATIVVSDLLTGSNRFYRVRTP